MSGGHAYYVGSPEYQQFPNTGSYVDAYVVSHVEFMKCLKAHDSLVPSGSWIFMVEEAVHSWTHLTSFSSCRLSSTSS